MPQLIRRIDILVQPEQVGGVIAAFERQQAPVVFAILGLDQLVALLLKAGKVKDGPTIFCDVNIISFSSLIKREPVYLPV